MLALVARETDLLARSDLRSVERVGVGSAPLTQALIETVKRIFPGALVTNGYGTTETGPIAFGPGTPAASRARTSRSGTPWRTSARGSSATATATPTRASSSFWTPALMQGYHRLPAKTAGVMTEDGYYRTGDVMRRDEHGFYYFVGRADDMFVCGGENIYPGEVERISSAIPDPAGRGGAGVGRGARSEAGGVRRGGARRDRHARNGERLRARSRPGLRRTRATWSCSPSCRSPARARSTAGS